VLLNITPDHLDRHGGLEGYAAAKRRLFNGQSRDDTAIVGIDDKLSADICAELKLLHREGRGAKVVPLTVGRTLGGGVFVAGGRLVDAGTDPAIEIADLRDCATLRGAHNWQNAAAAYAAARGIGGQPGAIADGLMTFPGLAHRQEVVARGGCVTFVNDSKATNAEAAAKALSSYDNIFWIAGGKPKEGGLANAMDALGHVRKAYLIGEAADDFAAALEGKVETVITGTIEKAVERAAKDARASGHEETVVLLSPACASFDQFKDYEERGETFRMLARKQVRAPTPEGQLQ